MPKLVDQQQRRAQLAEAVWTVIRRDGLERASVRNVAREAGLAMGSLRHYFATQSELLCFAMQLVGDRARARIAALEPTAAARRAAERLLQELVPLDDERRAEAEVWLAFTGRALVDPRQRAIYQEIHDQLHGACTRAINLLVDAGLTAEGLDVALEASRLHALLDGLALHAVLRPTKAPPSRIIAVIAGHLDALQASPLHPVAAGIEPADHLGEAEASGQPPRPTAAATRPSTPPPRASTIPSRSTCGKSTCCPGWTPGWAG